MFLNSTVEIIPLRDRDRISHSGACLAAQLPLNKLRMLVVIELMHTHLQFSGKFLPTAFEALPKNDTCTQHEAGLCLLGIGQTRQRHAAARRAEERRQSAARAAEARSEELSAKLIHN